MCKLFEHVGHSHDIDGCSYLSQEGSFQKDSKFFVADDIRALADIIEQDCEHKYFLVTHGTDRMAENADALKKELKSRGMRGKTVIFAGAMVPLSMENEKYDVGDASVNIRFALDNMNSAGTGVHVVGRSPRSDLLRCWDPHSVMKDMVKSREDLDYTVTTRR